MNCSYSQVSNSDTVQDKNQKIHVYKDSLIFNYRMLTGFSKYGNRYKILSSVNTDYRPVEMNYTIQNFLKTSNSSLLSNFYLVNAGMKQGESLFPLLAPYNPTQKEMFYGVWRSQLTGSSSEGEIQQSMIEGTSTFIDLGYSDLADDFLPFITGLMEEEHLINYDFTRTRGTGEGSKGVVTSVEILNALGSQDPVNKAGVCRDIHETGRLLLKSMSEVYFEHFYPEKQIDFDDYMFLQSWTTDASQHVTLSLINPLNTKVVYELDWGRVIERTNIQGYNNGRMYGNTFRIWQYDKEKQMSVPIDFRRTQFGKILDEDILTQEEYQQFNGIYDEEIYSNIRYLKNIGKYGKLNFSLGAYYPDQRYFLSSWIFQTKKKKVTRFLDHSNTYALQTVLHDDTRKKELLYPQADWQSTTSLMTVPRIISKFETKKFNLTGNFTFDAYLNQQFDAFLIFSSFHIKDSLYYNKSPHSGDGNLSFSNGFNLGYTTDNLSFFSTLTVQGRSCVLPKEIRLMSPNLTVLFSNIRFITPSIDAISNTIIKLNEKSNLSINGMLEFTNKNAIIFSGSVSAKIGLSKSSFFVTSIGKTDQLKGMSYFWYPVSGNWFDFQFHYLSNALSVSILKIPDDHLSLNVSFRKFLR